MNTTRALASINARFYVTVLLSAVLLIGRMGAAAFSEPPLVADVGAQPAAMECASKRT